jgi:peptidoglycan/LPS O-acetylase OafA/YrhL
MDLRPVGSLAQFPPVKFPRSLYHLEPWPSCVEGRLAPASNVQVLKSEGFFFEHLKLCKTAATLSIQYHVTKPRIPSLDGLRALSIALVIFSHLVGTSYFPVPERAGRIFALGELGVRVFFVISGFLITGILLSEARIGLRRFYFNRTMRIFPPYYVFLIILTLLALQSDWSVWIYLSNYNPTRSWNIGHTWSLSVEEQFYLCWPFLMKYMGSRRALWGAVALILLAPLIRLLEWQLLPGLREGIGTRFETIGDSIAMGCVLAGTRHWLHSQRLYLRLLNSRFMVVVPFLVLAASALHDRPRLSFLIGFSAMNIGIALCIDWCVTNYDGRVGRALNSAPLVFIGVMSYSIYLWQQIFLNRNSGSVLCTFPLNIVLVAACSLASYYLVEQPALAIRRRVQQGSVKQPAPATA